MNLDLSKPVKLRLPYDGEEHLFYEVSDYNSETGRCYITPINSGLPMPPHEIVLVEDIQNI